MPNYSNIFKPPDLVQVAVMLKANQLPVADLSELNPDHFLGIGEQSHPIGFIGLQIFSNVALLRSLVVSERARGQGCGKVLVESLEAYAREKGIQSLYLLTETAESFFTTLGYENVDRRHAPESIRQSREFSGLCPEDAIFMFKRLEK